MAKLLAEGVGGHDDEPLLVSGHRRHHTLARGVENVAQVVARIGEALEVPDGRHRGALLLAAALDATKWLAPRPRCRNEGRSHAAQAVPGAPRDPTLPTRR